MTEPVSTAAHRQARNDAADFAASFQLQTTPAEADANDPHRAQLVENQASAKGRAKIT